MDTDKIQFNTVLTDEGDPIGYDVTGVVTVDNQETHLGYSCFYFDKAFNELCYWVNERPDAKVTYTTSLMIEKAFYHG